MRVAKANHTKRYKIGENSAETFKTKKFLMKALVFPSAFYFVF